MKVLLVSEAIPDHLLYRVANFLPRLQHMPCTVLWAETNQKVEQYLPEADVVLLNRCCHTGWVPQNSSIYKASIPVARFYLDVWKIDGVVRKKFTRNPEYRAAPNTRYADFFREYDIRISPCKTLFEQHCPEWVDSMFWSPHCIDVQNYDVPKDIDVLFWGNTHKDYRVRNTMRTLLEEHIVPGGEKVGRLLTIHRVALNGQKYVYAHLARPKDLKGSLYKGEVLYKLISRAKICITGPRMLLGVPVGKFFENAACGTVSLTTDFTDKAALGFEHKKNIWITKLYKECKLNRFIDDLTYLLEHLGLVDEMSKNAKELIRTRHTPVIRAQELYEFLCKKTGKT